MTAPSAAAIAASIDTSTVEGHNLRALLLRLLDADPTHDYWSDPPDAEDACDSAIAEALRRSMARYDEHIVLTPLGREVAELLRPRPWQVTTNRGFPRVLHPNGDFAFEAAGELDLCRRIADLLTRDDECKAKEYRTS